MDFGRLKSHEIMEITIYGFTGITFLKEKVIMTSG